MGDLNCNTIADSLGYHTSGLMSVLQTYQFSQLINQPTRITNESCTTIDLFITNNVPTIIDFGTYPVSISDHYLIYAVRKIGIPRNNPKFIVTRNLKHFDERQTKFDLQSARWPPIKSNNDVNEAWTQWKTKFLEILDKHAPHCVVRARNKPAPWINATVRKQMHERDALKKKAQHVVD